MATKKPLAPPSLKNKITEWKVADLKPAEYNPRKITEKMFNHLKKSLLEYGDTSILTVNTHPTRRGIVVGGNQRLQAFKQLKVETINVREVCLDLKAEKILNVKLNKIGGLWDDDLLANEYEVKDLIEAGFEEYELLGAKEPKSSPEGGAGDAQPTGIIQYNIIFNNAAEQDRWFTFLKDLKEQYPEMETISERIIAFLQESSST